MAARTLLRSRALASVVLGGLAIIPATVVAEGPVNKKKSIYDDFDVSISNDAPATNKTLLSPAIDAEQSFESDKKLRSPSPTDRIAVEIGKARLALYRLAVGAEDRINKTMDSAFHLEQSFTSTIAGLAPSRESGEKLMPGTIYVLVAAMAGSIITRRSNILLRSAVPLTFGLGASWTVLPVTMRNISDLAWQYEQRFPAVAETHVNIRQSVKNTVSFAKVHSRLGVQYVDDKVTDAREAMEGWVKKGR